MVETRDESGSERIVLGRFPTPVRQVCDLPLGPGELWVKDDGHASELYGGNKVRKLERTLAQALGRGARRVVTVGAAGSHHVLATTIFARRLGLKTLAVLCPQPYSEHAEINLRLALAHGLQVRAAMSEAWVPFLVLRETTRGDYLLPPGGSNVAGTLAFVDAMRELAAQVARAELPEPDAIVAALGSGGTVGGMVAGAVELGLKLRVVGVAVARGSTVSRALGLGLARAALARVRPDPSLSALARVLVVDGSQLGKGYGYPTSAGRAAMAAARGIGLELDDVYTAKAFAGALGLVGCHELPVDPAGSSKSLVRALSGASGRPLRVLYWHTLSATAPGLPEREARIPPLPAPLRALLPHT